MTIWSQKELSEEVQYETKTSNILKNDHPGVCDSSMGRGKRDQRKTAEVTQLYCKCFKLQCLKQKQHAVAAQ